MKAHSDIAEGDGCGAAAPQNCSSPSANCAGGGVQWDCHPGAAAVPPWQQADGRHTDRRQAAVSDSEASHAAVHAVCLSSGCHLRHRRWACRRGRCDNLAASGSPFRSMRESGCKPAEAEYTKEMLIVPRRSARRRAAVLPSCLAAALLLLALLSGPAGAAAKLCTRFRGSGCHFTARHGEPVMYPACKSACHFKVGFHRFCMGTF